MAENGALEGAGEMILRKHGDPENTLGDVIQTIHPPKPCTCCLRNGNLALLRLHILKNLT